MGGKRPNFRSKMKEFKRDTNKKEAIPQEEQDMLDYLGQLAQVEHSPVRE
jgi:hypothetical protein